LRENDDMKIVVSGGSGFLGTPLVARLVTAGHDVAVLTRDPSKVRIGRGIAWHPPAQGPWSAEVAQADVVINLAGENVGAGRWSKSRKERLVSSRLDATNALVAAMRADESRQRQLISASAVGYYGFDRDAIADETTPRGAGFLAELTEKWEAAAREAERVARVVILRLGVVLDGSGGALPKMAFPFRFGAGGRVGSGKQWLSWIDREDALRAIEWAIDNKSARGVYNVTAPAPLPNREFAKALGRALHRPALLPTPALPLRLALGDMADEVLLGGQRVVPARITGEGFAFRYPAIEQSLARIFG
jgi:uncharacterized protein